MKQPGNSKRNGRLDNVVTETANLVRSEDATKNW